MNDNNDDRLADEFEQYRDDETTDHNSTAFGRTGTGKTQRIGAAFAKAVYDESVRQGNPGGFVAVDDIVSPEFIDPKGGEGESDG